MQPEVLLGLALQLRLHAHSIAIPPSARRRAHASSRDAATVRSSREAACSSGRRRRCQRHGCRPDHAERVRPPDREQGAARRARRGHFADLRRARARCPPDGCRRARVHRFRRRHRHAQRRAHARGRRARGARAGRALHAPVLLDRDVRALHRDLPPHLRAAPGLVRQEGDARQLGCRGRGERGQDRALRDQPRRGDRLRPGLPRPHDARHDADVEGHAVQEGLRPVRARGLPRGGPVAVPRHRHCRGAGLRAQAAQEPGRPRVGGRDHLRAGAGRGRLPPRDARLRRGADRDLPRVRHGLHRRRGADRHGTHGHDARRRPDAGRRARSRGLGQVARRRPPAGRRLRPSGSHGRSARRRTRRHVRRQPALVRGRARRPRSDRGSGFHGACPRDRRAGHLGPRTPCRSATR